MNTRFCLFVLASLFLQHVVAGEGGEGEITSSQMTSAQMTSAQMTSNKMTTAKGLTTHKMTTAKGLTTHKMTTAKGLTSGAMTTGIPIINVEVTVTVITITIKGATLDRDALALAILVKLGLPSSDAYRIKFTVIGARDVGVSIYIAPSLSLNSGEKASADLTKTLVDGLTADTKFIGAAYDVASVATVQKMETVQIKAGTTLTSGGITTAPAVTTHAIPGARNKKVKTLATFTAEVDTKYSLNGQFIGQAVKFARSSNAADQVSFGMGIKLRTATFSDQTLYVFKTEYKGLPSDLATSSPLSKAVTKNGKQWVFPSTVQFIADTTYYFYLGAPVTGDVGVISTGKRDIDNPFIVYHSSTGYTKTTSTLGIYIVEGPDDGQANGDPYFIGFNNQHFEFDGAAGAIFNIYNDPYMNLNSRFGVANSHIMKGTVMTAFGLTIGEHNITIDINADHDHSYFIVNIDGENVRVTNEIFGLSGCVDIRFHKNQLLVTTPKHDVYFYPTLGKHSHITESYFNVHIHHTEEEDASKIGGVLGQTAVNTNLISIEEKDFIVDDLFSFAASKYFDLTTIEC